jgi:hypothetical protein
MYFGLSRYNWLKTAESYVLGVKCKLKSVHRMKVLTTFHSPSSVSHSLKCRLISDLNIEHLVVTKVNRIDIYTLQATGLRHECDLEVWGKVLSIKAIPVPVCMMLMLFDIF